MSLVSPDRLIELWPNLPEEARRMIVELAEKSAVFSARHEFSSNELVGIESGRDDFKHGRTSSLPEYRSDMDAFFDLLKARKAL
jgi:hypothetical protein